MKKNNLPANILIVSLLFFVGCKSQEVTFRKVYEKTMPESASATASMKADGSYLIGFEEEPKGFGSALAFAIDGKTGAALWERKKNDLAEGEGSYKGAYWSWDHNTLLVFKGVSDLFSGSKASLSALDVPSGKVKFTLNAENFGGDWETIVSFLPTHNAFLLSTDNGFHAINIDNGEQIWNRPEFTGNVWKTGSRTNISFRYYQERDEMYLSDLKNLYSLNPATGETIWKLSTESIGSLHNADIFPEERVALFYGTEDESLGNQIAEAAIRSNSTGNAILNASESGLVRDEIILIDLKSGKLMNQSEFYTNGDHFPIIHNDKIIMMGIVLNVYDKNTGELIWQNIDEDRFDSELGLKALSFLTGIDLTVGNRSKQEDLIFDNHVYAFYPEVLNNSMKQDQLTLRKYNLDTGEEIWKSETEKINVDRYFGAEGVLFIKGNTTGFISRPVLLAFDATSGEKLYELKLKSTRYSEIIPTNGRIYVRLWPEDVQAFEINSGKEIPLNLPFKSPGDIRLYNNDLMVAYGMRWLVAHDPATFAVKNKMELPDYFFNYDYRGDTFFIYKTEGFEGARGIIGIDLEKWAVKGYILNDQSGTFTTTSGGETKNQVYKDYHLFLTEDGESIFELDDDVIKKYAVD
ncbi:PQQ-like domain-containing protein [Marivirga sericea]|uniref:PQQ-like domain-containing protein n=1 Tax=Marivirga sericea TaxID=1028 RepID=A0A1X7K4D8_9BACT|nr:PQQ-binding-like beta-propeller repeat protein [Marivirga sericea]SMG35584.1 PQQ-like domain-containing protein [Marivirga sericea]